MNVIEGVKGFEEVRGFVHVWSQLRWKHRHVVLSPGRLEVFLSDEREKVQKTIHLQGCSIDEVGHSKKNPSSLQLWFKLQRSSSCDDKLHQRTIFIIKPVKGKKLLILVTKEETNKWSVAIREAAHYNSSVQHNAKSMNTPDGSGSQVRQPLSEQQSGRVSVKRSLQLRSPWNLMWKPSSTEASPGTDQNSVTVTEAFKNTGPHKVVKITQLDALWSDLESYQGCTDFLKSNCLNAQSLAHASLMIDHFKGCYQMGDSSLPDELRLEAWRATLRRLIKTLVDHLLESNPDLESCKMHSEHMEQLWLACEVWVAGAVYDKIMGACRQMFSMKDKQLDQILVKLNQVSPLVLGLRPEFKDFVLGDALQQFRMINMFHTPLGKAVCLRKTVNLILDGIQRVTQSCSGGFPETDRLLPCTDDLLSFMLLLMARSRVKYLQANACYMQKFLFVQEEDCQKGELGYLITNFAAACEYLLSAEMQKIVADVVVPTTSSMADTFQSKEYEASTHARTLGTPHNLKAFDSNQCEYTDSRRQLFLNGPIHHNSITTSSDERLSESPTCLANSFRGDLPSGSLPRLKGQQSLSLGGDDIGSPKWIRDNYQVKEGAAPGPTRTTCRKPVLALPGSSPEFILSPTYV